MFSVRASKIHGRGVHARVDLVPDTWIPVAYYETNEVTPHTLQTEDGVYELYNPFRFLNHSDQPNAELLWEGDNLYLVIIEMVAKGDEIVIDYGDD